MTGFENQQVQATMISQELARKFVVLNIDWRDETEMRKIAREALAYHGSGTISAAEAKNSAHRAKMEVFGLIGLMLKAMEESADDGREIHGSEVWKAVSKALWTEKAFSPARS